jgi:hypothetical protein
MTTIRCSAWAVLGVALMFDVAPSCGGRPPRPVPAYTSLTITASDCSCARDTLRVSVDNAWVGEVKCGPSGALSISVNPGSHLISAESGTASWPARSHDAPAGTTTPVELGCPSK